MQNPVELFQNTIKEALAKNDAETQKWQKYKDEMVQSEKSLRDFAKKLQVEIMVPIGKKALMPGFLYHTSEILVGHGSKTFSKCTTDQAIRICKHRQKLADAQLEALQKEQDLHKNKIELPFTENAFGGECQEIIEDYDEETERVWREKHKEKVAAHKKQEAEERKAANEDAEDVTDILDELELMEELEKEFEELGVTDDEQVRKLMSGELKPPTEKKRVSHVVKMENKDETYTGTIPKPQKEKTNSETSELGFWDEVMEIPDETLPTEAIVEAETASSETASSETSESDDDTLSEEVQKQWRIIVEDTKQFNNREKRKYLKKKLRDVDICLRELKIHDEKTLVTKIDLDDLRETVQDEIIRLQDAISGDETEEKQELQSPTEVSEPRRIRFATEDNVKVIDKNEAPCAVSSPELSEKADPKLTLEIKFKHSTEAVVQFPVSEEGEDSICSPSDIYKKFEHCMNTATVPKQKSILKNKTRVLDEKHHSIDDDDDEVLVGKLIKKKPRKKIEAVKDILGDVVEKPVVYGEKAESKSTTESTKKTPRVSKFKENRNRKS